MSKPYTSIPGLGSGRGSLHLAMRNRLFQGADHLLFLQSSGYTEDYRRIFYRDIRYVVARKNNRQHWVTFIICALTLLIAGSSYLGGAPLMAIMILLVPFVFFLVVNLVKGPACDCYIRTDVQILRVPTPRRMSKVPLLISFLQTKVPSLESEITGA